MGQEKNGTEKRGSNEDLINKKSSKRIQEEVDEINKKFDIGEQIKRPLNLRVSPIIYTFDL
jgi:hypothetical protein